MSTSVDHHSNRRLLPVAWSDISWEVPKPRRRVARWWCGSGTISTEVVPGVATVESICRRLNLTPFLFMKHTPPSSARRRGFTLIEMLVVIAIIAILAAIILPALGSVRAQAKRKLAKAEMNMIASAIKDYEAQYDRYPASKDAEGKGNPDFTFGTGAAPTTVGNGYEASNAELMEILLDIDRNGGPNQGHKRNPKKTTFLNAKKAIGTGPGVGDDWVFRDAWGNPYVVTIDLNDDGKCVDAFYSKASVSRDPNRPGKGFYGLVDNGSGVFELTAPVMVWSFGPDGRADPNVAANQGVNKDNILSWTAN